MDRVACPKFGILELRTQSIWCVLYWLHKINHIRKEIKILTGQVVKSVVWEWGTKLEHAMSALYCFPVDKAGRKDFMHMIARLSIEKDIKNRKTMRGTLYLIQYTLYIHESRLYLKLV